MLLPAEVLIRIELVSIWNVLRVVLQVALANWVELRWRWRGGGDAVSAATTGAGFWSLKNNDYATDCQLIHINN